MGSGIINPLIGPLIFSDQGFFPDSSTQYRIQAYAYIMGIYAVGMVLGNPIWGSIADKIGSKKVILWTFAGSILGYLCCLASLVQISFVLFFFGRLFDGLMTGRRSISLSIISQRSTDQITSFKNTEIANASGLLLGPVVSGALINFSNDVPLYYYSTPFVILLIAMVFNSILVTRNVKEKTVQSNALFEKPFFNAQLLSLYCVFFVFQLGWFVYFLSITPYIILRWEFTPFDVGLFFTSLIIVYILTLSAVLPRIININNKGIPALLLASGGIAMMIMKAYENSYSIFLICNAWIVITMAINTPIFMATLSNAKKNHEQGKAFGLQNSIVGLSWLFASFFIGYVMPTVSGNAFIVSGLFFILVPTLQWYFKKMSAG